MSMRMLFVAGAVLLLVVAYFKPPSSTGRGPYHADLARTPGVVNPNVTQANIAATICTHGWTRTIRPPTDYTNALKVRQMREYGVAGAAPQDQGGNVVKLERGGGPTGGGEPSPRPGPPATAMRAD